MKKIKSGSFWTKEMPGGVKEYRTRAKMLFTALPFLLAALIYLLLTVIEDLEHGGDVMMVLAIGLSVLMVMAILLVLIVSLIEYLRKFE